MAASYLDFLFFPPCFQLFEAHGIWSGQSATLTASVDSASLL